MDETERKILRALAAMAAQYLNRNLQDSELDSSSMSAGERTLLVLAEYDLVALKGGHRIRGNWTEAGRRFLAET